MRKRCVRCAERVPQNRLVWVGSDWTPGRKFFRFCRPCHGHLVAYWALPDSWHGYFEPEETAS